MKKINKLEFNIYKSLLLVLALSVLCVLFQIGVSITDISVVGNYFKAPLIFILNFLPILLCMLGIFFLTNSITISFGTTSFALFLLLTVNHYKIYFRDEPLIPNDFNLINEATTIMQNYDIVISHKIVALAVAIIAVTVLLALYIKPKKIKWYIKLTGIAVVIAGSLLSVKHLYHNQWLYDSFVINENQFNDVSVNNSRGFLYNFLYQTTSVYYKKPEGYTPDKAEQYLADYGKEFTTDQNTPNIIAIMSEAFFDPRAGKNVKFVNGKNPLKEYDKIKRESLYGNIIVPGFAGGTSSTEFEFLSGANLSVLDKSLPTVYKTHITKNMYCLPYMLKEMGYRNIAIHPGNKWFYNRQNVYRRMGFEQYITNDDLPNDVEKVNWYVSDKVASDLIIENYDNHLKTNPDQKYFNFTVTIQNHGPYRNYELFGGEYIKRIDGMSDELHNVVNNYMYGLEDAARLLKDVTDYARSLEQPTVVVFFGDHLPYFDGEYIGFDKLGFNFFNETVETEALKHSVPYLIWGNNAFKNSLTAEGKRVMKGNYGQISSNFLAVLAMKYMDMEMSPFFDYVNDIFNEVKVISPTYFYDGNKYFNDASDKLSEKLKGYRYLQYYNMRNY